MTEAALTPIEIGLTAAIVTVEGEEPAILVAGDGGKGATRAGLPFGPFDALAHRTFEIGLRAWVSAQTGLTVGYVEQLYTFGDRGRHARPDDTGAHVVSIGYLALTRMPENVAVLRAAGAGFEPWYRFFPWEDWREKRPDILDKIILPLLEEWAAGSGKPEPARALGRRDRVRLCFGGGGSPWDEEKALDRYELLYEAGLVEEARRDGREAALARRPFPTLGEPMRFDHRRILATSDCAAARQAQVPSRHLRGDGARIHAHRTAAHRRGDLGPPPAQAEFPPTRRDGRIGGADRRDLDRDRRTAGGAVPLPPRGGAGAPRAGSASRRPRVMMAFAPGVASLASRLRGWWFSWTYFLSCSACCCWPSRSWPSRRW
jgi:hypothetical protein